MGLVYAKYGKEKEKYYLDFSCFNLSNIGWGNVVQKDTAIALVVYIQIR